jgi:hypothetical protein
MKRYALEALEILDRRQYARRHFLTTLLGGSDQNRRVEIAALCKQGLLRRHNPSGDGVIENSYPSYFHRIYSKASRKNKFNWHQVMVDDVMLSIEAACKRAGLAFRHRDQILKGSDFVLPANISWKFGNRIETYRRPVAPDELFSIGDTYFVLEADRGSETIEATTFENKKSALRSLLQYRDIFTNRAYQTAWNIPNLMVLFAFDNVNHMRNVMRCMEGTLKGKSRGMLFAAYPSLGSPIASPEPLLTILQDPWLRVGHEPFIINAPKQEVSIGHTKTASATRSA